MKKIGVVLFNLLFTSWALFTVYILLATAWFVAATFIVSPLLVVGAALWGLQHFMILNFTLAILLAIAAVVMIPVLRSVTHGLQRGVAKYFSQMRTIWYA